MAFGRDPLDGLASVALSGGHPHRRLSAPAEPVRSRNQLMNSDIEAPGVEKVGNGAVRALDDRRQQLEATGE
jgi:hypothetical protein